MFNELLEFNIGKSGNEYEQFKSVNECSVNKHLHGVLEIHEETFVEFVKVNKHERKMRS